MSVFWASSNATTILPIVLWRKFSLVKLTKNRYEERTWLYFRYAWKLSRRKETLSALKCEDFLVRIYRNNFFQCLMEYFFHRNIFSRWIINHKRFCTEPRRTMHSSLNFKYCGFQKWQNILDYHTNWPLAFDLVSPLLLPSIFMNNS